jgi:predicted dinucleotide-binding enzyme
MTVAILGTGRVARTLASALAQGGHEVALGSRTPGAVEDVAFPVLDHAAAIAAADLVVSAVTGSEALTALTAIGPDVLAGKVLIDLGNAVTPAFALMYPNSSLGAELQAALPRTKVVKTLNTLSAALMVAPSTIAASTVFLSGDDAEAKDAVKGLLRDLGWPALAMLDLGDIATARAPEHYFLLFAAIWRATSEPLFNINVVRPER